MNETTKVLRKLAGDYREIAFSDSNAYRMKLHRDVNDLRMTRPVVLIDELPWSEMNIGNELTLISEDPWLRRAEWYLRSTIYKHRHMPADMVVPPYFPVEKVITSSGIGIRTTEKTLATDNANSIVSHEYEDILKTEEDLNKLHPPVISYDETETLRRYNLIGEMIGDIIPVEMTGVNSMNSMTWDDISRYRGVTNLLTDLVDRPDFMHRIVSLLTEFKISEFDQLEAMGLLDTRNYVLHCTAALTDSLPQKNPATDRITRSDIWGRGAAQIFASVSPWMHEEFDIDYMKKTVGTCGLVYYGCCEPLHNKIDIVEKIPNIRKIGVTPWADVEMAAEKIGKKYVLSSKPNPAKVAVPILDEDDLRMEIGKILDACSKNGCSCDITLKDISSCKGRPENIFRWERIVSEMAAGY